MTTNLYFNKCSYTRPNIQILQKWPVTFSQYQVILHFFILDEFIMYSHYLLFLIATSIPIERVFSEGTDFVMAKRSNLSGNIIKVCMCLKSWWDISYSQN